LTCDVRRWQPGDQPIEGPVTTYDHTAATIPRDPDHFQTTHSERTATMTNQTAPLVICLQPRVCSVGVGSPEHHPSHGHLAQMRCMRNPPCCCKRWWTGSHDVCLCNSAQRRHGIRRIWTATITQSAAWPAGGNLKVATPPLPDFGTRAFG
jgi:hypothetical protein